MDCAPPFGSKFFHFRAVFCKNVKNNSNFGSWRPPWGKSWIRHKLTLLSGKFFAENCMKMKEIGPGGLVHVPSTPLRYIHYGGGST